MYVRLAELLEENNLSKSKLGKNAHINSYPLHMMMTNQAEEIDLDILGRICFVLNCSISDLLVYREDVKVTPVVIGDEEDDEPQQEQDI